MGMKNHDLTGIGMIIIPCHLPLNITLDDVKHYHMKRHNEGLIKEFQIKVF